jgi:hypothetical protein
MINPVQSGLTTDKGDGLSGMRFVDIKTLIRRR